ncbi:MAG: prephenate dehydrogenase/arogenate dehydrogenase family protein [Planctomycetales bacterium]|nr:prephenate dehydrogenase/arogenate dehydrogenase family protein [Planctomycetales bacterium]
MQYERVVIVGVGLLGGSVGLALHARRLARTVVGVGRHEAQLRSAQQRGAVDEYSLNLVEASRGADLAVICTPVQQIVEKVTTCAGSMAQDGLITDVGSTKSNICKAIAAKGLVDQFGNGPAFCGAHPLAGSEKSGVEFADSELFEDKIAVITPLQCSAAVADRTERFWQLLGSQTVRMTPDAHDQAIARTSHLPHVVASALAGATPSDVLPLVASGWRDTTRVAAGNVEMWRQIVSENRKSVLESLQEFSRSLESWIQALENGSDEQIEYLLDAGKKKRDAVGN